VKLCLIIYTNKTDKDHPKLPNALKKGFAKPLINLMNIKLAKYKGENKEVKLVDIVNLVHPVPTHRNKALLNGTC
jgi:hypothetical protein